MAYYIKKGNIFGRVGAGFGEGLGEELPKAMEARNLQQGVEALGKRTDLSPVQQLAYLQSLGASPQVLQSSGELLKQQGFRQQYQGLVNKDNRGQVGLTDKGTQPQEPTTSTPENQPAPTKTYKGQMPSAKQAQQMEQARGVQGQPLGQGNVGFQGENPLAAGNIPLPHWSPEKLQREKADLFQKLPMATDQQIKDILNDTQAREQQAVADAQAKTEYLTKQREGIEKDLTTKMMEKLQPEGKLEGHVGAFEKMSPVAKENIIRGAQQELKEHPEKSYPDVLKEWSDKALRFSKSMNKLDELQAQPFYKTVTTKSDANRRLQEIAKDYKNIGNSAELLEKLRTGTEAGGLGFSTLAAGHFAYPESPQMKEYLDTTGYNFLTKPIEMEKKAQKIAIDVGKKITKDDSLMSILWSLNQRDPDFDSTAFMRQIQEDQDSLGLTDAQKDELKLPATEWLPRWADFVYLPFFGKKR